MIFLTNQDLRDLKREMEKKINKLNSKSLTKANIEKIINDSLTKISELGVTQEQLNSLKADLRDYILTSFNNTFTAEEKTKLAGIQSGAEINVQANWDEINPDSDAYIKNKPTNLSAFTNGPGYLTSHQSLSDVFADVAYDSNSKQINFYGKGDTSHTNVIGSISAADFIKDGMISNVEIKDVDLSGTSTTCLVITFNTESNKEDINIPISKIFNATNYYTKTDIDGKGYLTSETDPSVPQWAKAESKPSYTASEVGALPEDATITINDQTVLFKDGSFDLGTIETIGSEVGTLNTNNTEAQTASASESFSGNISLHKISKTGSYTDLLNKPTIPAAQVQTDWNAVDGMGQILNKPDLAAVATSGNYSDLSNTPDLSGYITSETQLSKGTTSGEGNAVTDISVDGHEITLTKGKVQSEITAKSKLSADLIQDGNDNKVFTSTDKSKLDGITAGAEPNVQADWNASSGKSQILNKPDLATVATSGSYTDLSNKPNIPAAQVNSDWNASSGKAQILNKPSLSTVATSGSYNDLSNKPTITVNDRTIPVTNGTYDLGTISAIQGNGRNIDIVDNDNDATDSNTLYFFDNSLLQGVGLYNSLLQNGSIVGNDGKTYTYHPGKLYHLYSDGSFIELEYEEVSESNRSTISENYWKNKSYIACGDSLTDPTIQYRYHNKYCNMAAEELGLDITNVGISGSTMIFTDLSTTEGSSGNGRSFIYELMVGNPAESAYVLPDDTIHNNYGKNNKHLGPTNINWSEYDLITLMFGANDNAYIRVNHGKRVDNGHPSNDPNRYNYEDDFDRTYPNYPNDFDDTRRHIFSQAYEEAILKILSEKKPDATLVICIPPKMTDENHDISGSGSIAISIKDITEFLAEKYDLPVVDFYESDDIDLDSDGIHPSQAGQDKMAEIFKERLLEIGMEKMGQTVPGNNSNHKISYKDNIVYYNDKQTSMKRYGDLVIPHRIKYADTSDTAYFFLQVKGPFFAEKTEVTLTFNEEEIEVYETSLLGIEDRYLVHSKKNSTSYNGHSLKVPNVEKIKLNSGDHIDFTYSNFYKTRNLLIKRIKGDPTETPLTSILTLNNGYEDYEVKIKFSVVDLVFKNGVLYQPIANFSENSMLFGKAMEERIGPMNESFYSDTEGYLIKSNYLYKNGDKNSSDNSLSNLSEKEEETYDFIFIKPANKKYRASLNYDYNMEIPGSYYVKYKNIRFSEYLKPMGIRYRTKSNGDRVYWADTLKDVNQFPPGLYYSPDAQFPDPDSLSRMFGESIVSCFFHDLHHEPVRTFTSNQGVVVNNEEFGTDKIAHLELAVDAVNNEGPKLPGGCMITEIGVLKYSDPFDDNN